MKIFRSIITITSSLILTIPSFGETIVGFVTDDDLVKAGFTDTKTNIPGKTVLCDNAAGSFSLAYDDMWGVGLSYGLYQTVKVGDSEEILLGYGPVGNTNPVFTSYQQGVMSAGAVFELYAKKDGWMTVFTQMNPAKQYVVFEGDSIGIPYTLGVAGYDYKINYTLPVKTIVNEVGEKFDVLDFDAKDASLYFEEASVPKRNLDGQKLWIDSEGNIIPSETRPEGYELLTEKIPGEYIPKCPYQVAGKSATLDLSTGYLTFKVKAGHTYYVSGIGSKIGCQGFVYSDGDNEPAVVFVETEYLSEIRFGTDLYKPDVSDPDDPSDEDPVSSDDYSVLLTTTLDLEKAGLSTEKTSIPGGTEILNGDAGSLSLAYDDEWRGVNGNWKYETVKVGDSREISLGYGVVGNTNPTFTSYQQGVMSAGAVFELYAKKDGWMTVFTRMNPGKQYVVFEGKDNGIPYTLGVAGDGYMINYSLPGKTMTYETGEETYTIDFDVDGADRYFREATVQKTDASGIEMWMNDVGEIIASETRPDGCSPVMEVVHGEYAPEYPYIAAGLSEAPATSTGYLTFKVRAGRTYYVSALGSKMICPGFVFSSGEKEPAVTFVANEYLPEVRFKTDVYVPDVSEPDDPYVGNPEKSGSSTIMLATDDDLMSAGLETTKQDIPGGTVILNGETGKFSLAYDDEWGTAASYGKYRTVRINDSEEITLGEGAVGNTNPVFTSYQQGVMSGGAVFRIDAKKTGWMTVFTKMNLGKQYVVFEDKTGAVPYTLGSSYLQSHSWSVPDELVMLNYTLPYHEAGAESGFIDFNAPDADRYFIPVEDRPGEYKPQFPYIVAGLEEAPSQAYTGFLTFQVKKGKSYYVSALGSKMSCQGFVFTESKFEPVVTFCATEDLSEIKFKTGLPQLKINAGDQLEYEGLHYVVTDPEALTCRVKEGSFDEETGQWAAANEWRGHLTIPEKVSLFEDEFSVTEIGQGAFAGTKLYSVKIPGSVKTIGAGAFDGCAELATADLPEFLTHIGEWAFSGCVQLTDITLPETLVKIEDFAFDSCAEKLNVTYSASTPIEASENIFSQATYTAGRLCMNNAKIDDIKATTPWNRFVRIIASDATVGGLLEGEDFEYDGLWFTVTDNEWNTCKVKGEANEWSGDVEIPSTAYFGLDEYSVVELGGDGFHGSPYLTSVTLPATMVTIAEGAFEQCPRLTSLVWNNTERLDGRVTDEIGNPNLLLYVVSKEYAPVGFEGNVVEAGVCDLLTLTPGYPFTPVREFRALQSRMVKKFNQKTYIGLCSGWESIVLPFDVKNVYAENIGSNLTPYGIMTDRHNQRPYWLYEADADGDWKEAYSINAGVPYILSVPNNSAYPDGFNVMGDVVFSSDVAQQISPDICSPATITWNSGQEFRALWLPLGEDEKADAMAINVGRSDITDDNGQPLVPGSAFCAGLEPKPLEAYVAAAGAERMMRIFGDASGVEAALGGNGVDVSATGGEIRVSSDVDRTLDIVTPDGKVARKLQLKAGEIICVTDLHGGIYLVAGRKIIVK